MPTKAPTQPTAKTRALPKDGFYTKAGQLIHWVTKLTKPHKNLLSVMEPIPYGFTGSTYGACGIRVCGTPEFIDAVMSRLPELLDGENQMTRLTLSRDKVKSTEIKGQRKDYTYDGNEVLYIQLNERGGDAIGIEINPGATQRYIDAVPGLRYKVEKGRKALRKFLGCKD